MARLINNASKTIAVTNTPVSRAYFGSNKETRVVLHLTNTSVLGEVISISVGAEAKAGQGNVLNQGQSISWSKEAGYIPPQDVINAVASAATATLAIYEEVEAN